MSGVIGGLSASSAAKRRRPGRHAQASPDPRRTEGLRQGAAHRGISRSPKPALPSISTTKEEGMPLSQVAMGSAHSEKPKEDTAGGRLTASLPTLSEQGDGDRSSESGNHKFDRDSDELLHKGRSEDHERTSHEPSEPLAQDAPGSIVSAATDPAAATEKKPTVPSAVIRTMEEIARRHMLPRQGSFRGKGIALAASGVGSPGPSGEGGQRQTLKQRLMMNKKQMLQLQKSLRSKRRSHAQDKPKPPPDSSRAPSEASAGSATAGAPQPGPGPESSPAAMTDAPVGSAGATAESLASRGAVHRRHTERVPIPGGLDDASAFRSGASRESTLGPAAGAYPGPQSKDEVAALRARVVELEGQLRQLEQVRSAVHETRDRLVRQESQDRAALQEVREAVLGWRADAKAYIATLPAGEGQELQRVWEEKLVRQARREASGRSQRLVADLRQQIRELELRQTALHANTLSGGLSDIGSSLFGFFLQGLLMFLAHVGIPLLRPLLACMAWARPGLRANCPIVLRAMDCECCCPSEAAVDDSEGGIWGDQGGLQHDRAGDRDHPGSPGRQSRAPPEERVYPAPRRGRSQPVSVGGTEVPAARPPRHHAFYHGEGDASTRSSGSFGGQHGERRGLPWRSRRPIDLPDQRSRYSGRVARQGGEHTDESRRRYFKQQQQQQQQQRAHDEPDGIPGRVDRQGRSWSARPEEHDQRGRRYADFEDEMPASTRSRAYLQFPGAGGDPETSPRWGAGETEAGAPRGEASRSGRRYLEDGSRDPTEPRQGPVGAGETDSQPRGFLDHLQSMTGREAEGRMAEGMVRQLRQFASQRGLDPHQASSQDQSWPTPPEDRIRGGNVRGTTSPVGTEADVPARSSPASVSGPGDRGATRDSAGSRRVLTAGGSQGEPQQRDLGSGAGMGPPGGTATGRATMETGRKGRSFDFDGVMAEGEGEPRVNRGVPYSGGLEGFLPDGGSGRRPLGRGSSQPVGGRGRLPPSLQPSERAGDRLVQGSFADSAASGYHQDGFRGDPRLYRQGSSAGWQGGSGRWRPQDSAGWEPGTSSGRGEYYQTEMRRRPGKS